MATCNLWFGTKTRAEFIDTPLSGAESTPESWQSSGSLLNGGGFSTVGAANHKVYDYSWRRSSTRQMAQKLQAYRQGAYGPGLLYFVDPLIYDTNVLPAQWSTFTSNLGSKAEGPLPGTTRGYVQRTGWEKLDLPASSVRFTTTSGSQGLAKRLYIPIPEGFELYLGGFFEAQGYEIRYSVQDYNYQFAQLVGGSPTLTPLNPQGNAVIDVTKPIRGRGVELWINETNSPFKDLPACANSDGKPYVEGDTCYWNASQSGWGTGASFISTNGGATKQYVMFSGESKRDPTVGATATKYNAWIDIWALTARLNKIGTTPDASGPWVMGQGHSGAKFDSEPTYVEYNGIDGGQVGFAATFREVGSWQ